MENIYVEAVTGQQNALLDEQKQFPLIGEEYALQSLDAPITSELSGNPIFERKFKWIVTPSVEKAPPDSPTFSHYRPVRRDGSCFYRCALYSLFNIIAMEVNGLTPEGVGPPSMATALQLLLFLSEWKATLTGYFGDFVEDFLEVTSEAVKKVMAIRIERPPNSDSNVWRRRIGDEVITCLNDIETNSFEYIVCLARYGVSSILRANAAIFAPFVNHVVDLGDDELTIKTYCEREVDVVGGECEEVHLLAFSAFFKVQLQIVVIDNNVPQNTYESPSNLPALLPCEIKNIKGTEVLAAFSGTEGAPKTGLTDLGPYAGATLNLLYRPGHYEILI